MHWDFKLLRPECAVKKFTSSQPHSVFKQLIDNKVIMESSTGSDNKPQQKKKPQRKEGNERRDRSKSHRPKGKQSAKTNKDKEKEAAAPVPEPAPAEPDASQKEDDDDASSVDSGELCFICTEPIVTYAVGACDHRFCHLCALRLRALYKTRNCAYCKVKRNHCLYIWCYI